MRSRSFLSVRPTNLLELTEQLAKEFVCKSPPTDVISSDGIKIRSLVRNSQINELEL